MCGIAGWFSRTPLDYEAKDSIRRMVTSILHRGPDGNDSRIFQHAALGHARLAIIDIEGGQQPLCDQAGRYHIIFNGEIYNYRELRTELIHKGFRFNTTSDTEVILALYALQGIRGFENLRGMFAFAIWDEEKQEGLLVRDPIGIKPLFYSLNHEGCLCFASEAKAIIAKDGKCGILDEQSLHFLLNFRYLPGDRSLFRGIRQLAPGTVLHWTMPGKLAELTLDIPASTNRTKVLECLRDSVQKHFVSDVEVGAYLSGGIDSATIVALGKQIGNDRLRTFTLDVGDDPEEAQNATRTAELLGVMNIQAPFNFDIGSFKRLIWHLEVPKVNSFQVSELARLTSRHVKVALSGLGGDEIFLGYNMHRIMALAAQLHHYTPSFVSRSLGRISANTIQHFSGIPWRESERACLMFSSLGNWPRTYGILRNIWDTPELRRDLYGPRMHDAQLPNAYEMLEELWPDHHDPVMAAAKFEWRHKMVNDLLWQEDRCSMAEGLEVRVPFLDINVAKCLQPYSRDELMPRGRPKAFMHQIIKSLLSREILDRPKSGFQLNAADFFDRNLRDFTIEMLSESRVRDSGLFNYGFIKKILKHRKDNRLRWHFFMLYLMLGSELWLDLFERESSSGTVIH